MEMDILDPPVGFAPHDRKSPLTDPWEPLYSRKAPDAVVLGLRAGPAHTNSRGFVHGGLIGALADNAMGLSCGRASGHAGGFVTVNLNVDFLSTALDGAGRPVAGVRHGVRQARQDLVLRPGLRHRLRPALRPRQRRVPLGGTCMSGDRLARR